MRSWIYRLYIYWISMGGSNKQGYKENLCHFVRVLVFWAPWFWFTRQRLYAWIRAWMLALVAAIFTFIAIFPKEALTIVLTLLIMAAGGTVLIGMTYLIGTTWKKSLYIRWDIENVLSWPWLAIKGDVAWEWFWKTRYKTGIYPWSIFVTLLWVSSFFWSRMVFLVVLTGILVVCAFFLAVVAYVWAEEERITVAISHRTGTITRPIKNVTGLTVAYVKSAKRKICPYISFV